MSREGGAPDDLRESERGEPTTLYLSARRESKLEEIGFQGPESRPNPTERDETRRDETPTLPIVPRASPRTAARFPPPEHQRHQRQRAQTRIDTMNTLTKNKKKRTSRDSLPDLPIVGNQRNWNIAKVVLRSLCLAVGLVIMAELIMLLYTREAFLQYNLKPVFFVIGPGIAWDLVEFITMLIRRSIAKGVPLGVHVGAELVLWLGCIAALIIQIEGIIGGTMDANFVVVVTLSQLGFLVFLVLLRFVLFVRACVEVDRLKRDQRVRDLVFAIQKHGWNTQSNDVRLAAQELSRDVRSTVLETLSPRDNPRSSSSAAPAPPAPAPVPGPPAPPHSPREERDFTYKYNFPITTAQELLESGIHPEEARNQKVLIGAFPRTR
ncbi:hypothetical protein GGR50DRAFT_486863 [Xylaria sp. CBS 124048]|nr:hypothetical protein GGR50DRAFT_486863 [Xylaria sp. CBS 124048]